jgi:predicted PurR-regulated permease PerM
MAIERVIVVVRPRTILLVVALSLLALALLVLVRAAGQVAQRVVVAGTLACLLRPLVLRLARRMPFGVAVAVTLLCLAGGFAVLTAVEIRELVQETNRLKRAVPTRVEEMRVQFEPGHAVRRFVDEAHVEMRVKEWLDRLPSQVVLGTDNPARGASRLTTTLLVTVLTLFTITRGPQAVWGTIDEVRDLRLRAALERIVRAGYHGGTSFALRTLALALASGIVGALTASALDVPAPAVLGLFVGVWSLVPVLGVVVGYLPIVGLAAAEGPDRAVAAAMVLAAWVVVAAIARRRWIADVSVHVSRLLLTVAVMAGLQVGRITGAVVALFLAAAAAAALVEARRLCLVG